MKSCRLFIMFAIPAMLIACSGGDKFESSEETNQSDSGIGGTAGSSGGSAGTSGTSGTSGSGGSGLGGTSGSFGGSENDSGVDSETPTECNAGEVGCDNKVPWKCSSDNKKIIESECEFICSNGKCEGSCLPGTKRCDGIALQYCDQAGVWQTDEVCPKACDSGTLACVGYWCCKSPTQYQPYCECEVHDVSCPSGQTNKCEPDATDCCMNKPGNNLNCYCYSEVEMKKFSVTTCEQLKTVLNGDPYFNNFTEIVDNCGAQ